MRHIKRNAFYSGNQGLAIDTMDITACPWGQTYGHSRGLGIPGDQT